MGKSIRITLILISMATVALLARSAMKSEPDPAGEQVLLLELFTSQGCSSCPPADRLLTDLSNDPELRDKIVPIAFHVDYWNYIGWTDPYSSPAFSARQRAYGRTFRLRSVYTPQLIIQGERQMVGSKGHRVRRTIRELLARERKADLRVEATKRKETAEIEVSWSTRQSPRGEADLFIAVVESDLVTEVPRGENRGRTLHNDHVVRSLELVNTVSLDQGSGAETVHTRIDPGWNQNNLRVVSFLQAPGERTILAVTSSRLH